ncbi:hypothetical protein HAX54_052002, partial [Datura stramonium]|nr:hypothetical protein [Datura stramonium]
AFLGAPARASGDKWAAEYARGAELSVPPESHTDKNPSGWPHLAEIYKEIVKATMVAEGVTISRHHTMECTVTIKQD